MANIKYDWLELTWLDFCRQRNSHCGRYIDCAEHCRTAASRERDQRNRRCDEWMADQPPMAEERDPDRFCYDTLDAWSRRT